jgi:hypothetical protein
VNRRVLVAGALALAAGSIAAGCGGGDQTTTVTGVSGATGAQGAALSKSQFIAQGDQICTEQRQTLQQAASSLGQNPTSAQIQQLAQDSAIPAAQSEIDQLRQLTPPTEDVDQINAILDAAQQGLDKLKQDPSLLTQPNAGGAFDQADHLAKQYGFTDCGN